METSWRAIGASIKGTSHQKKDIPCQDAHSYRVLSDGVAIVAVADGAGSAERSDEGAQCAVDRVIAAVEAALMEALPEGDAEWEALLTEAYAQAQQAIVQLAADEELSPRAFATTLTCAIAADECLVTGQIGDGVVVASREDGGLFTATLPQRGEYANETYFLTMDEALERVEVCVYPEPVAALAVMTDGLIRLAMNVADNEPHPPFFQPVLAFAARVKDKEKAEEQLATLLTSERVCERTDDDKTLVLVARPIAPEDKPGGQPSDTDGEGPQPDGEGH